MRSRSLLIVIALVAAGLLVLLWRLAAPGEAAETRVSEAGRVDEGARKLALPEDPRSAREEPAVAGDPAREALPAPGRPPAAGEGCRIRVVRADTGAPVPEARVWLQRDDVEWMSGAWWQAMRRFNDVEPVLQGGLGLELTLDARGEVVVPRAGRRRSLAAALGELHGDATLLPKDELCVVELKAYHSLRIEVVDRAGQPLSGARVILFAGDFDPYEHRADWPTDADGRVWIPKLEGQIPREAGGSLRVVVAGGAPCTPEFAALEWEALPSEPVRLVVGEAGRVVVEVVDGEGRTLDREGYVDLEMDASTRAGASAVLRASTGLIGELEHGRTTFAGVGLGLALDAYASPKGFDGQWRSAVGPSAPGEEVLVSFAFVGPEQPWARGRLLGLPEGRDGKVFPVLVGACASAWADFQSTAEGAFEARIQFDGELGLLRAPWTLTVQRPGEGDLRAEVVPSVDELARVLDFGDVELAPLALLATLHVVDEAGAPVGHARIEVEGASDGTSCDARGTGILGGDPGRLPLRVRATLPRWLESDWLVLDRPGAEATLTLLRPAELRGTLELPDGLAEGDTALETELAVEPAGDARPRRPMPYWTSPVVGGRFRFDRLEAGRGRLTVAYGGRILFERGDIALVGGRTTELEPIDLRSRLNRFELVFELAGGAPWTDGHLELVTPDDVFTSWTRIGRDGRALVFAEEDALELYAAARGARPTHFEGVHDGDRLTLLRGSAVLLRAPEGVRAPAAPLQLLVRGARIAPEEVEFEVSDEVDDGPGVLGEDGTARLEVPWPGEYALTWSVSDGANEVELELGPPQTLRIDGEAGAAVEAHLTREALARAVAEAGG